jgi:glutathione reductase (NADPH)
MSVWAAWTAEEPPMSARYDCDLFVIGGGSGGVRAARMAAAAGARTILAEERDLGGTCVHRGCIPKKMLSIGAHFREDFADAAAYGWSVAPALFDWPRVIANKDKELARLGGVYRKLLSDAGVRILDGRARLLDPHTVSVGGKRVSAERILIATGGRPTKPSISGAELGISSDEAFHLEDLPRRAIVVGGGYIGVEFAGILHGFGAEVTQLYRGSLFLRGFDQDIRAALAEEMRAKGVALRFGLDIARIERAGVGAIKAVLNDGSEIEADCVLFATGRGPNTAGLGLAEAGVALDPNGAVKVNDELQSSVPSIYALGDVIDRVKLTPVALAEAMALVRRLYLAKPFGLDYDNIPTAVFSHPPIGTVGLSEEKARTKFGDVDVYRAQFRPLKHTLTGSKERTMMKLVVEPRSDRVVGLHMVGQDAPEIVQGFAVAIKAGATKAHFDATIGIHPTAAEEFVTMRSKLGPSPASRAAE